MSATQTTTTTTRKWNDEPKENTKKTGKKVAKAYSAALKKSKASNQTKQRRCPTCGRPL